MVCTSLATRVRASGGGILGAAWLSGSLWEPGTIELCRFNCEIGGAMLMSSAGRSKVLAFPRWDWPALCPFLLFKRILLVAGFERVVTGSSPTVTPPAKEGSGSFRFILDCDVSTAAISDRRASMRDLVSAAIKPSAGRSWDDCAATNFCASLEKRSQELMWLTSWGGILLNHCSTCQGRIFCTNIKR